MGKRTLRRKWSAQSSEVYFIDPLQLRRLGLEVTQRNRQNAYGARPENGNEAQTEKTQRYDGLKAKIKREGFRPDKPITVMLLR